MRAAAAQAALRALKRRADYEFFFAKLESPEWLPYLQQEGYFRQPPPAERDGTSIAFPFWPEMDFLIRVAARKPARVTRIIRAFPPTDNARIHSAILDAALAMPARYAASLVRHELAWLKAEPYLYFVFPDAIERVVAHLCEGGYGWLALELITAVLAVGPDPKLESRPFSPRLQLKLDPHEYGRVLARAITPLARVAGVQLVGRLVRLLQRAIRLSRQSKERGSDDYSYYWHDNLTETAERASAPREALASALAVVSCSVASTSPAACREVLSLLAKGKTLVFRRLEMHLVARVRSTSSATVRAMLVDRTTFDDSRIRSEYFELLQNKYARLATRDRKLILSWIDTGPDIEVWRQERFADGTPIDEATILRWVRQWQRDRLAPIRASLSEGRRKAYDRLVEELGPPETDQRPVRVSVGWGSPSPLPVEVARAMSIADIASRVRTWEPTGVHSAGTWDGLASVVSQVAGERAEEFSAELEMFADCPPLIVSRIMQSLASAARAGAKLRWDSVLSFCESTLASARPESPGLDEYRWLAKSIADLVNDALTQDTVLIGVEARPQTWRVIAALCSNPDPTAEETVSFGDAYTHAINSVRGRALEATIHFARWCHATSRPQPMPPAAFETTAPETGVQLDLHLDESREGSAAVRAVFGAQLPQLVWLDREWVRARITRLLPTSSADASALQRATLWAYIKWGAAGTFPFELIRAALSVAADDLKAAGKMNETEQGAERLAEHLMVWNWRGDIGPNSDDRILSRFFEHASVKVRAHAFDYIGRSLRNTTSEPPREVIDRIQVLWDWRWAAIARAEDRALYAAEVESFAGVFGSDYVDAEWGLDRLLAALKVNPALGSEHQVVERLARLAATYPLQAVEALASALLYGTDHASYWIRHDEVRALVARIRETRNPHAWHAIEQLVNRLLAKGHFDAAVLLGAPTPKG